MSDYNYSDHQGWHERKRKLEMEEELAQTVISRPQLNIGEVFTHIVGILIASAMIIGGLWYALGADQWGIN